MPLMWLNAHIVTLGELQAEESFRMAEIISIGAGKLDKRGHAQVTRRWNAALGNNGGAITMTGQAGDVTRLRALGVEVRVGPR